MIRVTRVLFTVPAKDWYAKFKPDDRASRRLSSLDHPVIAWVLGDYCEGEDAMGTGWFGLGVWNDGPDYFEAFSDFTGYVHRDDL